MKVFFISFFSFFFCDCLFVTVISVFVLLCLFLYLFVFLFSLFLCRVLFFVFVVMFCVLLLCLQFYSWIYLCRYCMFCFCMYVFTHYYNVDLEIFMSAVWGNVYRHNTHECNNVVADHQTRLALWYHHTHFFPRYLLLYYLLYLFTSYEK